MDSERKRNTHNSCGSINGPSIRGRVGLTLKLDEISYPLHFKTTLTYSKKVTGLAILQIFISFLLLFYDLKLGKNS